MARWSFATIHIEHVDGRQQGMQAPGQHRFACAPATGNNHAAETRIHRGQQQGQLEGAVAGDRCQGKGAGGLIPGLTPCDAIRCGHPS